MIDTERARATSVAADRPAAAAQPASTARFLVAVGLGLGFIGVVNLGVRYAELVTGRYITGGVPPVAAFGALIVLLGHGVQFKGDAVNYYCPMDAKLEQKQTLVSIADVYRDLEKCPAAFKLLIADCCRNDPQSDFSLSRRTVELESVTRPQRVKPPGGVAAIVSLPSSSL